MDTKNKQGYWTEGKNVNGTNIGGGVYVSGVNPSSATTNVAGSTASQPMTQPPLEVPSVFDSTRLGEKPINLPQPVQNNGANTALSASTGAFVNNASSNPTNPVVKTPQEENVGAIQTLISKLSNKGKRTQEINKEMNIDEKKQRALKLEQQAISVAKSYDDQIKQIQEKNVEGQFGSGVQGEIQRINRQKNSELADIAIQQKVAIEDYNSAIDVAQKKIDAEFEPLQTELQNRQNLFNMLQNNMTEKEKLDYQNQLAIDKKSVEDLRKAKSDYSAIAIQNGNAQAATAITNAKTEDEVLKIASTYGLVSVEDQYKKAQIGKLNADAAAAIASDAAVNPEVLQGMLNVYKSTGTLPAFGMSAKSPLRAQFYAALGADGLIVTDANTNKSIRAGLSTAYRTQQNLLSANQTAIGTLDQQLDLVKRYSDQIDRTNSPLVNKYLIGVKTGVFGDPDAAALNNIVKTASYEFAKILSGSAASISGVSVTSAADAESMLNSAMSRGQFTEIIDLMKKESNFRISAQKDTLKQLEKDMNNVGSLSNSLKKADNPQDTTSTSQTNYSSTDFRKKYEY